MFELRHRQKSRHIPPTFLGLRKGFDKKDALQIAETRNNGQLFPRPREGGNIQQWHGREKELEQMATLYETAGDPSKNIGTAKF